MSTSSQPPRGTTSTSTSTGNPTTGPEKSYFETQRAALVGEIAVSFEHVLANINKLNRSMEEVIVLGNEFSSVEALWSQFENVMAKDPEMEEVQAQDQVQAQVEAQARSDDERRSVMRDGDASGSEEVG